MSFGQLAIYEASTCTNAAACKKALDFVGQSAQLPAIRLIAASWIVEGKYFRGFAPLGSDQFAGLGGSRRTGAGSRSCRAGIPPDRSPARRGRVSAHPGCDRYRRAKSCPPRLPGPSPTRPARHFQNRRFKTPTQIAQSNSHPDQLRTILNAASVCQEKKSDSGLSNC